MCLLQEVIRSPLLPEGISMIPKCTDPPSWPQSYCRNSNRHHKRRVQQVKYVYTDAAEAQRQQTQIAKNRISIAEKEIADLERKISQHQRWLDK